MLRFFLNLTAVLLLAGPLLAQTTYYSRATGDWNATSTWSTVSHAGGAAATVPGSAANDIVVIGAGHTVRVNQSATFARMTLDDDGAGGILAFPFTNSAGYNAAYTLTLSDSLMVLAGGTITPAHPTEFGLPAGTNTARTHGLVVQGNIRNDGVIDLEGTATDRRVNLTLSGAADAVVRGAGTWDFTNAAGALVFNKSTLSVRIESRSANFTPAGRLTWTSGHYIHNNSGTFGAITDSNPWTLTNASITVTQGQLTMMTAPAGDRTITIGGTVTVNGGVLFAGSNGASNPDFVFNGAVSMTSGSILTANAAPSGPTYGTDGTVTFGAAGNAISGGSLWSQTMAVNSDVTVSGAGTSFWAQTVTIAAAGSLSLSQLTAQVGINAGTDGSITLTGGPAAPRASLSLSNGATLNHYSDADNALLMGEATTLTVNNATYNLAPDATDNDDALQYTSGTDASNMTTISISNGGDLILGTGTFGDLDDDGVGNFVSFSVDGAGSSFVTNGNANTNILRDLVVSAGATFSNMGTMTVSNTLTVNGNSSFTLGVSGASRTLTANGTVSVSGGATTFTVSDYTLGQDASATHSGGTTTVGHGATNTGTVTLTGEASQQGASLTVSGGTFTVNGNVSQATFNVGEGADLVVNGATVTLAPTIAADGDILWVTGSASATHPTTITVQGGGDLIIGSGGFGRINENTTSTNLQLTVTGAGSSLTSAGDANFVLSDVSVTSSGLLDINGSITTTSFTLTSATVTIEDNGTEILTINGTGTVSGTAPSLTADNLTIGLDATFTQSAGTTVIGNASTDLGTVILTADAGGVNAGGQMTLSGGSFTVYGEESNNTFEMQTSSRLTLSGGAQLIVSPDIANNNNVFRIANGQTLALSTTVSVSGASDVIIGTGTFGDIEENVGGANSSISVTGAGSSFVVYGTGGTLTIGDLVAQNSGVISIASSLNLQDDFSALTSASVTIGDSNAGTLTVNGTMTVNGAATSVSVLGIMTLNGTANINAGTVEIADNVVASAVTRFTVAAAATVNLNGGTLTLGPNVTSHTANSLISIQGVLTVSGGSLSFVPVMTSLSGGNIVAVAGGTLTINSGVTMNVATSMTSMTGGNIFTMSGASFLYLNNGTINIATNSGLTSISGGGNPFNQGGTAQVYIGDGAGAAASASMNVATGLTEELPLVTNVNVYDLSGTANVVQLESDGFLQVGGANRGDLRVTTNTNTSTFTMNGGTVNITASFNIAASGFTFTINDGEINIGTDASNGANALTFLVDPAAPTSFVVAGGTVNIGDGNSAVTLGDGDNAPTIASGNYHRFEISAGTVNLNGRFDMNDRAARFIMSGGTLNVNPQGDQDLGGNNNVVRLYRGAAQITGGTFTLLNPNPNAGGNGTTTGMAFLVSESGDGTTVDARLHNGTGGGLTSTFTGSTIRFGDGTESADGSTDGFDLLLATSFTYSNIVVNNPSGNNRHVRLASNPSNGTVTITNLTVTAGDFQIGISATPTSPNVAVTGAGNFVLGAGATLTMGSTSNATVPIGNEVNFPYGYASYSIGAGSTIVYSGNGSALVGLPAGSGETIENLTLTGTGTKTITTTHAQSINGTLRLTSGTLNVGTNLTLNDGAVVLRDGTDALGIIGTGTLQQANAAHAYTIRYEGASKTAQSGEWTTGGTPGLRDLYINMTAGQILTLNTNRTVRDLTLNSGTLADGGFNLEVNRHLTGATAGTHTGTGDIEITGGAAAHQVSGILNVEDLTLNDGSFNAELQTGAELNIGGILTLTAGSIIAGDGLITFDLNASIAGTPSSTAMIRTSGTTASSGVRKTMQAGVTFTFPVGVTGKYTPATITVTAAFGSGPVTLKNITGGEHPVTQDASNLALNYYWAVSFTGMTSVSDATLSFQYVATDVGGTETLYVPARYVAGANPWSITGTTAAVQENTPSAGFGTITYTNVGYLSGEYTAGESSEFNNATVQNFYSLGGPWDEVTSWSTVGYGGAAASSLPAANTPVFIGNSATITVDAGGATTVPSISLENTGILDIEVTPVTSFGTVSGTGTMRVHTATFPTGTFTTFLSASGGTVEYRGAGNYTIPASPTNYNNLTITGNGTTKTLPNANLQLYGNMTVSSGVTVLLSAGASGNLDIDGNLTVTGSSSVLRYQNTNARSVTVDGSVTVSTSGSLEVANSAAVANTLTIGSTTSGSGNLTVTNGTFRMLNGTGVVNVTFAGTQDATLSVPSGGTPDPVVIFNRLIVNKGTSATPVLNVNCANTAVNAFVLSGPNNTASKALELQNGTFRISAANTNGTVDGQNFSINLSTGGGDFTIPSTAGLRISGGSPVVLSDSGGDDIVLNGALTVDGTGTLIVGTITTGLVANAIKYSSTSAALTVGGTATVTVSAGVRGNGTAALVYTQSGGTLTAGRYGRESGEPAWEITNHANSRFNMSDGTLIVVRGGVNDSESTQILSATNTVTGGTFQVTSANSPTGNHRVRLNAPVYNLSLPFSSFNGQIDFNTYDVVVQNNFTQDLGASGSVLFQDGEDLRVDGTLTLTSGTLSGTNLARTLDVNNFVQSGGTFSLLGTTVASSLSVSGNFSKTAGTFTIPTTAGTTTFDGSSTPQTVASNTALTFFNVTINNSATSGVVQLTNVDLTVNGNWTTTAGDLDAQTNTRTVTFASSTQSQTITGSTTFYNLTINNTFTTPSVTLASGTLAIRSAAGSGGTLTFTAGYLDIGNNSLVIRNTDTGAISGANSSRYIRMGGTTSALGVTKFYPGVASDFTFPIGVGADYTPARLNATAVGTSSGQFTRVRVIDAVHPVATSASVLSRYWDVDGTNWSGGYSFDAEFTYVEADIHGGGNDATYIGAYYIPTAWTQSGDIVTEGSNLIGWTAITFATADFTAGDNGGFGAVTTYYSWGPNGTIGNSFNWGAPTASTATSPWSGSPNSFVDISASGAPSAASPVFIQRNHTVTITGNGISTGSIDFDNTNGTVALVLGTTTGHNFGVVDGTGIIRLESGTLPGGTYTDFYTDGGVFEFTGSGTYTIPAGTYRNLTVSGTGTKTAAGNLSIEGDLTVETGAILDLDAFTANRTSAGGTMTINGTGQLLLSGTNNFPANYSTYTLSSTSTVTYDAAAIQTIAARTYGNLTLSTNGTFTKSLAGNTVVAGNLTVNRSAGNPVFSTANNALSVAGNIALTATQVVWSSGTSTITLNGGSAQTITRTGGGAMSFQGLTVNNASGVSVVTSTAATNLTVTGTLTLTNGAFAIGGSGGVANSLTLSGTVSSTAGTLTGGTMSDLTLSGTGAAGTINFTAGGRTLRNLTMNRTSTGSVIFGTDLSIGTAATGTVTLTAGIIDMGANLMTITRSDTDVFSAQGSTSTHIEGRLAITYPAAGAGISRRFPVASDGLYRPVTISGSPVNAVISVEVINAAPTINSKESALVTISTIRYFRVRLTSGTFNNPSQITMFFNLGTEDESINDPADLRVARSTNNSDWTNAAGSGAFTAKIRPGAGFKAAPEGSVTSGTSASVAGDTYYAVASATSDNPLPVELSVFDIRPEDHAAALSWTTLTETDHFAFSLHRRRVPQGRMKVMTPDDTLWTEVYKVHGNGNSYDEKNYLFKDETLQQAGTYEYRLLQIDYNGVTTIYGPYTFEFAPPAKNELLPNFPNPFNPVTVIPFSLSEEARVVLQVFDLTGRKVMDLTNRMYQPGRYRIAMDASRLASGIYLIRMQTGGEVKTRKVTLLR